MTIPSEQEVYRQIQPIVDIKQARKDLFLAAAIQGLLAGPLRRHSLTEIDRSVELELIDVADEIATLASGIGEK